MTEPHTHDLLADLGLAGLPETERNALLEELSEVIYLGAMRRAWNALDVPTQDELMALLDASSSDPESEEKRVAVDTFIKKHVPDFEAYLAQEVTALKKAREEAEGELES